MLWHAHKRWGGNASVQLSPQLCALSILRFFMPKSSWPSHLKPPLGIRFKSVLSKQEPVLWTKPSFLSEATITTSAYPLAAFILKSNAPNTKNKRASTKISSLLTKLSQSATELYKSWFLEEYVSPYIVRDLCQKRI